MRLVVDCELRTAVCLSGQVNQLDTLFDKNIGILCAFAGGAEAIEPFKLFKASILTDRTETRQIVSNYANHALKFLLVDSIQETATDCCSVSDTERGIKPTELTDMFAPYTQSSSGSNRTSRALAWACISAYLYVNRCRAVVASSVVQSSSTD